jgi:hypothetical protein
MSENTPQEYKPIAHANAGQDVDITQSELATSALSRGLQGRPADTTTVPTDTTGAPTTTDGATTTF